jgi:hypothetical protein
VQQKLFLRINLHDDFRRINLAMHDDKHAQDILVKPTTFGGPATASSAGSAGAASASPSAPCSSCITGGKRCAVTSFSNLSNLGFSFSRLIVEIKEQARLRRILRKTIENPACTRRTEMKIVYFESIAQEFKSYEGIASDEWKGIRTARRGIQHEP